MEGVNWQMMKEPKKSEEPTRAKPKNPAPEAGLF
jgi:hypothetical protein